MLLLLGLMRGFARASVPGIKTLLHWIAALAGVSLALLLILTGRGGFAIFGLSLLLPMIWDRWGGRVFGPRPSAQTGSGEALRASPGTMSSGEALQILGLKSGSSTEEIKAAHRRLMAAAHPDHGGSDWIAARLNQARDVLLG
ncbi:MAG: hypothetical protein EXR05_09500 [Acetobacteraceae bacterium]|nr:hypothetical protein [Acetobacteraceae bacterium]